MNFNPSTQESSMTKTENLAQYLTRQGKDICADNGCTEENHHCESYAYINDDMELLDLCASDYFQGSSRPNACIPMPWHGSYTELRKEVRVQIEEYNEQKRDSCLLGHRGQLP
jgi:hypothetical protein